MDSGSLDLALMKSVLSENDLKTMQQLDMSGRVDVPLRSFQPSYYPTLWNLYKYLDIPIRRASHSICWGHAKIVQDKFNYLKTIFNYRTLNMLQYTLPIPSRYPHTFTVIYHWFRLISAASALNSQQMSGLNMSIGEYLRKNEYPESFINDIFIPFWCAICTCPPQDTEAYPANIILEMLNRGLTEEGVYQVTCGIKTVCSKLLQFIPSENMKFGYELTSVVAKNSKLTTDPNIVVNFTPPPDAVDTAGSSDTFHHVIFATPLNVTAKILTKHPNASKPSSKYHAPPSDLIAALQTVPYHQLAVTVHTDQSVMPPSQSDWREINIFTIPSESPANSKVKQFPQCTSTVYLNTLHPHLCQLPSTIPPLFQTQNPLTPIPDSKILKTTIFPRASVTSASLNALNVIYDFQGHNNMFFVGSACYPGVPLLEGCVATSIDVAKRLGVDRPWQVSEVEYRPLFELEEYQEGYQKWKAAQTQPDKKEGKHSKDTKHPKELKKDDEERLKFVEAYFLGKLRKRNEPVRQTLPLVDLTKLLVAFGAVGVGAITFFKLYKR